MEDEQRTTLVNAHFINDKKVLDLPKLINECLINYHNCKLFSAVTKELRRLNNYAHQHNVLDVSYFIQDKLNNVQ